MKLTTGKFLAAFFLPLLVMSQASATILECTRESEQSSENGSIQRYFAGDNFRVDSQNGNVSGLGNLETMLLQKPELTTTRSSDSFSVQFLSFGTGAASHLFVFPAVAQKSISFFLQIAEVTYTGHCSETADDQIKDAASSAGHYS